MGPFSDGVKKYVSSVAMPLVDPDYNFMQDVILTALLRKNDISAAIISNMLYGAAARIQPMLTYAANEYTLGLPGGMQYETPDLAEADIQAAIEDSITSVNGILIDYHFVAPLNLDFIVLPFLINQRAYHPVTHEISILPGDLVLDQTITVEGKIYPLVHKVKADEINFTDTTGLTATIVYEIISTYVVTVSGWVYAPDEWTPDEYVTTHTVTPLAPSYHDEVYTIPTGMKIDSMYCIAKYFDLDAEGGTIPYNNWWFYELASGEYPLLNLPMNQDSENHFFPVVPLRYNNVDYTHSSKHDTDLYKTSKILLKKMGLSIQDLGTALNDNPSSHDIDHAYVMYGVNLQSENYASIRYLVEFFDFLADEAVIKQNDYINYSLSNIIPPSTTYTFNGNSYTAPSGVTVTMEEYEEDHNENPSSYITINNTAVASLVEHGLKTAITYQYITSNYVNGSIGPVGTATMEKVAQGTISRRTVFGRLTVGDTELVLRHQETAGTYKEVRVRGLIHQNIIYHNRLGVTTALAHIMDDPDNDNFIIPLHYGISKRLPLSLRNKLYMECLHIVANSYEKVSVKWYETKAWGMIFKFIGLVIAMWTGNPWILAFTVAMEVLSHILSPELMMILNVIFIIYSLYSMNYGAASTKLSSAQYFLGTVSCLASLVQVPTQLKLMQLAGEFEDLAADIDAASEELALIQEQLDTSSFLDAGLLLGTPRLVPTPNESPTAFYTRTLKNNAGLLTLDIVQNYHTALLQLPRPDFNSAFGTA